MPIDSRAVAEASDRGQKESISAASASRGSDILGLVWRKIGIGCVLEFSSFGEVVRFVGLPCGR